MLYCYSFTSPQFTAVLLFFLSLSENISIITVFEGCLLSDVQQSHLNSLSIEIVYYCHQLSRNFVTLLEIYISLLADLCVCVQAETCISKGYILAIQSMTAGLQVTMQTGAWQKTHTSHQDYILLLLPPASSESLSVIDIAKGHTAKQPKGKWERLQNLHLDMHHCLNQDLFTGLLWVQSNTIITVSACCSLPQIRVQSLPSNQDIASVADPVGQKLIALSKYVFKKSLLALCLTLHYKKNKICI